MRLIHTADWHLGRLFHNVHLTRDQEAVLQGFIDLVAEVRPHAVLIAGDLYDRAVPPTDAVELLDHVLTTVVLGHRVPVVAIAGNHDSPARVGFGSAMLRGHGLHLVGGLCSSPQTVTLHDDHGPVHIHALPFADPSQARAVYEDDAIHDQHAVLTAGIARALAATPSERRVALAHAFVAGSLETPDSERPISVGGAGSVPAEVFQGFDYVALGHLHRPQEAGAGQVYYAGSLMKYSFAEHDHGKSVSVVDIGAPGTADGDAGAAGRARVAVEHVALHPPRDVRRVQGTLAELLVQGRDDPCSDDYILASLLDTGAVLDAIGRLREVYPNTLQIERPALDAAGEARVTRPDPRKADEAELFESFFVHVSGDAPTEAQRRAFAAAVDQVRGRQREVTG